VETRFFVFFGCFHVGASLTGSAIKPPPSR
jgi:hypothetical protein